MGVLVQVLPAGASHVVADDVRLQARLIEAGTQVSYKTISSLLISVSHLKELGHKIDLNIFDKNE